MAASDVNLEKEFEKIINDYKKKLGADIEECLTDAGNLLIIELSNASPVGLLENPIDPHFKDCWAMKTKYKGVRYVGNTKKVHDGIPLSNLIEFSRKGHPFIQRTFELNKDRIYKDFIEKLGGKLK